MQMSPQKSAKGWEQVEMIILSHFNYLSDEEQLRLEGVVIGMPLEFITFRCGKRRHFLFFSFRNFSLS